MKTFFVHFFGSDVIFESEGVAGASSPVYYQSGAWVRPFISINILAVSLFYLLYIYQNNKKEKRTETRIQNRN